MAPTERTDQDITFFIADRLRGIPLVTRRSENKKKDKPRQAEDEYPTPTSVLKLIESGVTYNDDANTIEPVANRQFSDAETSSDNTSGSNTSITTTTTTTPESAGVAKRDIDAKYLNQVSNNVRPEILFKPSGITASTANLMRHNKQPATTPRPIRTTTSARPNLRRQKQTTTTTTPRPRPRKNPSRQNLQVQPRPRQNPRSSISTTTTTNGPTVLSKIQFNPTLAQTQSGDRVQTTTMQPAVSTRGTILSGLHATHSIRNDLPATITTSGLTKATLAATTQPDHQRRNPQTLSSSRYANRATDGRNAYAGENWVLFTRPDGGFSFFEILVLMSNIMIVGTIIFVIAFNWFRSLRKKKLSNTSVKTVPQSTAAIQQASTSGANTNPKDAHQGGGNQSSGPGHADAANDRGSKLSMISSGVSNMTPASASDNSGMQSKNDSMPKAQQTSMQPKSSTDIDKAIGDVVSGTMKIANEFRSAGGMNVANKAMAIVQPTENNSKTDTAQSDADKLVSAIKDELSAQSRAISRSVSDLSGGSRQKSPAAKDNTKVSQTTESIDPNEVSRVAALEDLFSSKAKGTSSDSTAKSGAQKARRTSTSSLESVELPQNLVESIEKSISRRPENVPTPSPNLLLGEVEPLKIPKNEPKTKPTEVIPKSGTTSIKDATSTNGKEPPQTLRRSKTSDNVAPESSGAKSKPKPTTNKSSDSLPVKKDLPVEQERPENPMGHTIEDKSNHPAGPDADKDTSSQTMQTEVKNHQLVVNKLDKRKTNLEIVDIRDESVTGKMRDKSTTSQKTKELASQSGEPSAPAIPADDSGWISMEGVAVTKPTFGGTPAGPSSLDGQSPTTDPKMSPSEIIENRFHVDYGSKRRSQHGSSGSKSGLNDSLDSKTDEMSFNNIESELEKDNKMKNRKYFVYIVHDGHFTAKKECIARIDLPPTKRRVTLAEMRQLIANSQDISLVSLRRNRFKFVTETYRLLNENEDAAVLHQVYPTQGVFLKLNIPEQENQSYLYKSGRGRTSTPSGGGGSAAATPSLLSQATISSRRKAAGRVRPGATGDGMLPTIEVDYANSQSNTAYGYGRSRATSVGRSPRRTGATSGQAGVFPRSKSSMQAGALGRRPGAAVRRSTNNLADNRDRLPSLGRLMMPIGTSQASPDTRRTSRASLAPRAKGKSSKGKSSPTRSAAETISTAATDIGANVISGAKKLFSSTFRL